MAHPRPLKKRSRKRRLILFFVFLFGFLRRQPRTILRRRILDSISSRIFQLKFIKISFFVQDYNEDEDEEETTTPATTTTITTTTTTTTTTTPKPVVTQNYDYRDPKTYEGGTGAQYNGYQSRSDYPSMSAHSVHKWQSLGTRESVKETRSNMQQYNKNGKSKLTSIYATYLDVSAEKKKEKEKTRVTCRGNSDRVEKNPASATAR